jgi:hypothetical protein
MEKTMALTVTRQRRLEMQGFICSHDGDFARVAPWLRWSPALCMIVAAIGTALASPPILLALAATAALGAILPFHPFDLIYNYGIRYATGTRPLPGNGAPRRFACAVGAVWLIATAWAFSAGAMAAGYVLGGLFVLVAGIVSTADFCIPSFVYSLIFRRPRIAGR